MLDPIANMLKLKVMYPEQSPHVRANAANTFWRWWGPRPVEYMLPA